MRNGELPPIPLHYVPKDARTARNSIYQLREGYYAFVPLIGAPHFLQAVVLKTLTQLSVLHLPHVIFSSAIVASLFY